jgi:hypothetical protein
MRPKVKAGALEQSPLPLAKRLARGARCPFFLEFGLFSPKLLDFLPQSGLDLK